LFLRTISSSHHVGYTTVTRQLGRVLLNSAMYRVLSPQKVRAYQTGFYSNLIADTLLSLCPFRVCPAPEINRISPIFPLLCLPFGPTVAIPKTCILGALVTGVVVSSPKRWPPLLGFFGPHHYLAIKRMITARVYLFDLGKLVVISNSMVPS
jgi:hypothetical protein